MKTILITLTILIALPWTVSADCYGADTTLRTDSLPDWYNIVEVIDTSHNSTTVQLHISADALMIRMPSGRWYQAVEDSSKHITRFEGFARMTSEGIVNISEEYHWDYSFGWEYIDSIPETSNSTVHVERFPKNDPIFEIHAPPCGYGVSIISEDSDAVGYWIKPDSTKEQDK